MKILEIAHVDFALYQFLLPLMRRLRSCHHQVIGVCAEGRLLEKVRQEGFQIRTVPFVRSFSIIGQLKAFWILYRIIKLEKPDIVHAHMSISGVLARIAAFLCGTPVIIYTCHGYLFNQPGKGIKSWIRRLLSFVLEWGCGKITNFYMTVSQEEARDAKRLGIHSNPIFIGNGRDPAKFFSDIALKQKFRQANKIPQNHIVFMIVSRLVQHKGYPELIVAFSAIAEKLPEVELWIVGERLPSDYGLVLDKLFNKAQKKLGNQIRFWGYRQDIDQLMKAADVFVLPSHFEGLPMSIIEAMLSGLPVIGTSIRGPREQVQHSETGLLIPPGSISLLSRAMAWLAFHPEQRKKMGENGRARALSMYTEAICLDRVMNVFSQIDGFDNPFLSKP